MKKKNNMIRAFVLGCAAAMCASAAMAAPILNVHVKGNHRVEDATVESYLGFGSEQEYSPELASQLIKNLYATGLFANVTVDWDGEAMTVTVAENPLVNKIAFEGNEEIADKRLEEVVGLYPRAVYAPGKVQSDVQTLKAAYRQRGLFLAEVSPQIIQRDQNRVDVIYKIEEGEPTVVEGVKFVGNHRFGDSDLRSIIRTKESRWWRFLSTTDVYDPSLIEVDKELLRRHYIKHGFADFQVTSAVAELSRDKSKFFVTFSVSEGPKYNFGAVDVKLVAEEEGLTTELLADALTIESGQLYNGERVEKNIDALTDALGEKGYAFLEVDPRFSRNEAERTVDVSFNVVPGPRVYVNRINIVGNDRTQDEVIRREMRFAEGDAFSSNKLSRSRDRLDYLGFFENVEVNPRETEFPDRVDLDVKVAEQSTGEFNAGIGYSSYESALASADIRERNFMGRGQDVSLKFAMSAVRKDFRFAFTEPWFMNQELLAGFDLFNENRDYQDESSYDLSRSGGQIRFGFPIDEFTQTGFRLGAKTTKITDVGDDASKFIKAEDNDKRTSFTVGNTFAIDTRDSRLTPTHGYNISMATDYSGLGGDVEYLRGLLSASWHTEVADGWVLSLGGRLGAMADLGGDTPVYENFQGGGSTLRGFERGGVGPRDSQTDDALGGRYVIGNNVDLTFPLPGMEETGVSGILFMDGGLVTGFEDDPVVQDTRMYRVSVGTGIFWRSPLGPLRFEFGLPVVKAEEDKTQIFSFSVGTRF